MAGRLRGMSEILSILQPILAVLVMISILVQAKGTGLGSAFGGGGFYSSRRGVEKVLFRATIVLVALFFIDSIAVHLF